jgi:hypothetical protein
MLEIDEVEEVLRAIKTSRINYVFYFKKIAGCPTGAQGDATANAQSELGVFSLIFIFYEI